MHKRATSLLDDSPRPSAGQLEAAAHDAAGRHTDAIAALSRAAAAGDLAAKRTVGLRILLGDRAPLLGAQGVQLIAEAGAAGDADAAQLASVLAGAGIHCPQSWDQALDWLQHAAELGSPRARGALAVLCGDVERANSVDAPVAPAPRWGEMRQAVDLAHWLAPSASRDLHSDPLIRTYSDFAGRGMCDWLISSARGRLARAKVYNPRTQERVATPERTNSVAHANLLETDLAQIVLQARIAAAIGLPFANFEPLAVLHYAPDQAFEDHYDFVDPDAPEFGHDIAQNGQRLFTFLLYLNRDYTGGETAFPHLDISHRGDVGEGFLFRNVRPDGTPDRRTLHAGRPPRSGGKWVLSQFVRDRAVVPGAGR